METIEQLIENIERDLNGEIYDEQKMSAEHKSKELNDLNLDLRTKPGYGEKAISPDELFDGREFYVVPKGQKLNPETMKYVGKEVTNQFGKKREIGISKNWNASGNPGRSKGPESIGSYEDLSDRGNGRWTTIKGDEALKRNKRENPEWFTYLATNVETGEKLFFAGKNLILGTRYTSSIEHRYGLKYREIKSKVSGDKRIFYFTTLAARENTDWGDDGPKDEIPVTVIIQIRPETEKDREKSKVRSAKAQSTRIQNLKGKVWEAEREVTKWTSRLNQLKAELQKLERK